ncbi:Translation machinery-associated protein 22 [Paramicrosporidium saccamoebae]|uniref:Translation machinery-associated protein 22 n=1 Tax=Paramicrosporidium saccamoebae TaxID=1246581 RepID=A0A2H9TNP0_9FUNG|nr:Translation machinery-associated protein 22 [Paramicrosporidium saccamoebae]
MAVVPRSILYCGGSPFEHVIHYCGFTNSGGKCKKWLAEHHPDLVGLFYPSEVSAQAVEGVTDKLSEASIGGAAGEEGEKKHQSRGGKAIPKDESKKLEKEEQRKKVAEFEGFNAARKPKPLGLDLKKIAKRCASKYACGCSVARNPAGYDEIVIQGDFVDDLLDFIPEEWPEISEDQLEIVTKSMSAVPAVIARKDLIQKCAQLISSWKLVDISKYCHECGLSVTGTKAEQIARLSTAVLQPALPAPFTLVSLDIGILNFAKAVIEVEKDGIRPILRKWEKTCLDLPATYHPRNSALCLREFAASLVADTSDQASIFLIERQTFRGGGFRMIPGNILNINRIEVQLHCFLLEHNVFPINARSVASIFGLESRNKKKHATKLVDDFCNDLAAAPIDIPSELASKYALERKKDDMADSLLQGLAFLTWRDNLEQLRHNLHSQLGNRVECF